MKIYFAIQKHERRHVVITVCNKSGRFGGFQQNKLHEGSTFRKIRSIHRNMADTHKQRKFDSLITVIFPILKKKSRL